MARRAGSQTASTRVWRGHIEGWQESGVSQRAYCARHGLAISTFQLWRRRLVNEGVRGNAGCVELVRVPKVVPPEPAGENASAAVVVCVGPFRVEVGDGARVSTLRCVLEALGVR